MQTVSPEFLQALKDATVIAPELPETEAFETLEALEAYEHTLLFGSECAPHPVVTTDYHEGSARETNEIALYGDIANDTLVSADHATSPYSKKKPEYRGADHGTGSLAMLLANRDGARSIVPLGRQSYGVEVSSADHPIKRAIDRELPGKKGFMSLHGMYPGKLHHVSDAREIHAIVGLGLHENEQSREVAERIVAEGKDLGLRVVIGNDEAGKYKICDPKTGRYKLTDSGDIKTGQMFAGKEKMTTNFAHLVMECSGVALPAFQLELTHLLLQIPSDVENGWHVDRKARAIGVHLGYLLGRSSVEAVRTVAEAV